MSNFFEPLFLTLAAAGSTIVALIFRFYGTAPDVTVPLRLELFEEENAVWNKSDSLLSGLTVVSTL